MESPILYKTYFVCKAVTTAWDTNLSNGVSLLLSEEVVEPLLLSEESSLALLTPPDHRAQLKWA